MKKRILVHVGPPKTGSSAIQKWLNNNRDFLSTNGFMYPEHSLDPNGISSGNFKSMLDVSPERNVTFVASRLVSLIQEFNQSDKHTLLLSSEYFINQVSNILSVVKENISFICYVRPPIEFVESIYNQSIKRNGISEPIFLRKRISKGGIDGIVTLNNTIGTNYFQNRAYSEKNVFYENIIYDFCEAIDLVLPKNVVVSNERVNSSYAFESLEIKRWLNEFVGKEFDYVLDPLLQKFTSGIDEFSLIPAATYESYRRQSKDIINDSFAEIPLHNKEALITYIESLQRKRYCHQELNNNQIRAVAKYLYISDFNLYSNLCDKLTFAGIKHEVNDRYLTLFLENFIPKSELFNYKSISKRKVSSKIWLQTLIKTLFRK